jgi:SAM-dependent methyltransferase
LYVKREMAELTTNIEVLESLFEPEGRDVLDVGCGGGWLARELAARGARVTGTEISDQQLADARARGDADGRISYVVGRAEALPLSDVSVDAVVFMNSLHHVPEAAMSVALRQARRVLRPGGRVFVAEPQAEGEFYAMVKLVEDEDHVRAMARRALDDAGAAGLERVTALEYDVGGWLADVAALRQRVVSVDPARTARFDAHETQLTEAFHRLGSERDGGRSFTQPMRAELLCISTPPTRGS